MKTCIDVEISLKPFRSLRRLAEVGVKSLGDNSILEKKAIAFGQVTADAVEAMVDEREISA